MQLRIYLERHNNGIDQDLINLDIATASIERGEAAIIGLEGIASSETIQCNQLSTSMVPSGKLLEIANTHSCVGADDTGLIIEGSFQNGIVRNFNSRMSHEVEDLAEFLSSLPALAPTRQAAAEQFYPACLSRLQSYHGLEVLKNVKPRISSQCNVTQIRTSLFEFQRSLAEQVCHIRSEAILRDSSAVEAAENAVALIETTYYKVGNENIKLRNRFAITTLKQFAKGNMANSLKFMIWGALHGTPHANNFNVSVEDPQFELRDYLDTSGYKYALMRPRR